MPSVTGKVYNCSKRMKEKRTVLDGVAAEVQRIIGQPRLASPNSPHDQGGHFAVREDFIGLAAEYQTP